MPSISLRELYYKYNFPAEIVGGPIIYYIKAKPHLYTLKNRPVTISVDIPLPLLNKIYENATFIKTHPYLKITVNDFVPGKIYFYVTNRLNNFNIEFSKGLNICKILVSHE